MLSLNYISLSWGFDNNKVRFIVSTQIYSILANISESEKFYSLISVAQKNPYWSGSRIYVCVYIYIYIYTIVTRHAAHTMRKY